MSTTYSTMITVKLDMNILYWKWILLLARACGLPSCSWNIGSTLPENGLLTSAAESGGGKIEDDGINTGVEGAKQQGVVPPSWTLTLEVTQDMGDIVRYHTNQKHS